jgi:acyl-CoA thioesterase FadM
MSRVRLEMPEAFSFSTEIAVRITDVNYGGHLGNDALLTLLHEARVQFLRSFGWSEMDAAGAAMIMTDAVIVYRHEAYPGDILRVEIAVCDLQATTCDIFYRVTNRSTGIETARIKTGIAFFDYERRKIVPMPDQFRSRMS